VNDLLSVDLPPDRFVTALVAILDSKSHEFRYISAGQGPLLHYRAASGEIVELETQGPPFGVAPGFPYDPALSFTLGVGDALVFLTDGFYEWSDIDGKQFGTEGVARVVRESFQDPAEELIRKIYSAVVAFARGAKQQDDLTAVVLKRTG
jgi:phosphoserine phosphatase